MRKSLVSSLVLGAFAIAQPAAAASIESMLEAGQLKAAYNPILLDYLVEEGTKALPEAQHKEALEQLVTALRAETDITAGEQQAAGLATAAALLAQAFGGGMTAEMGSAASDATHQIYDGWIDAANGLLKAGFADEANAFFEKCMAQFPYPDLQGRCALGLARANPEKAIDILIATSKDSSSEGAIKTALWVLGGLAASDDLGDEHKVRIIEHIESFTGGLKKATYGRAACRGLVRSGDERVKPRLMELKGGMMNSDISPCALRGLLLTFGEKSVVPDLAKKLKGGMLDTTKPADKLFAARTLIEADEPAGFEWAAKHLTGKKKQKDRDKQIAKAQAKGKKAKWKKPSEGDLRNQVISALVDAGGDRALQILNESFVFAKKGSWIETWIALALYRLGDDAHIDLLKNALETQEWDFTVVRIAEAFADKGDTSGLAALGKLYGNAVARAGKAKKDKERNALRRLRSQIAAALAKIDTPASATQLAKILGDGDARVRASAAYGLARMTEPSAVPALTKALAADYGESRAGARTPVVHAHVARAAALKGDSAAIAAVLEKAAGSSFASVKFLALCAQNGSK